MKRVFMGNETTECTPSKVALVERNAKPGGLELLNSYSVGSKSRTDLIELATEIQKADNFVRANVHSKLSMIAEQMRFLHKQAEKVLKEAVEHDKLHHVACNFVKHPGHIYHLYERQSGQCYFSMLSPEEWGDTSPPQRYLGSYRLEQDHSWTPISQIESRDTEIQVINKLLASNEILSIDLGQNSMSVD